MDESIYNGSDMANIVSPRKQTKKRAEEKAEKDRVLSALRPAVSLLKQVLDKDIAKTYDPNTYRKYLTEATQENKDALWHEMKVRMVHEDELNKIKRILDDTEKGLSN